MARAGITGDDGREGGKEKERKQEGGRKGGRDRETNAMLAKRWWGGIRGWGYMVLNV